MHCLAGARLLPPLQRAYRLPLPIRDPICVRMGFTHRVESGAVACTI